MISAKFLRALLTDEIIALRTSRHQLGPGGGGSESSRRRRSYASIEYDERKFNHNCCEVLGRKDYTCSFPLCSVLEGVSVILGHQTVGCAYSTEKGSKNATDDSIMTCDERVGK